MGQPSELKGPDLSQGIPSSDVKEGEPVIGHAKGEAVVVVRRKGELFGVGASCTHYGGPLGEGIVSGETIRCPWHHACFSLRTGAALAAPALSPIPCWRVEEEHGIVRVVSKSLGRATMRSQRDRHPRSVVIIGGGAAGHCAAEMLRRESYTRPLTILSADESPPCDRPNLSKDYLAGNAPEEWIPLRPETFYKEQDIHLFLNTRVTAIDTEKKCITTAEGKEHAYDALLVATGAEPSRLSIPGADRAHVLRTLADSRRIIEASKSAKRAVVIGASFIGLEVAASLRTRGLEVHVVAREKRPLERVMGPELGDFIRAVHEEHGVVFHLGTTPSSIDEKGVTLSSGETIAADLVVMGVGVKPRLDLAEKAGLTMDRGILVNEFLETSVPKIFAAGDVARYPDPRSKSPIRVEHWTVAERHGQIAARNMLGEKVPCKFVPFFWSQHYDVGISYVGHAESWDRIAIEGDISKRDCVVSFVQGERAMAVATIGRDRTSLERERAFENES